MNAENAIEVKDIKKSFKVFFDKSKYLKERILFWNRNRYEVRTVLKGISFSVKKGEAIGLVGHNGCGKSTSLKLLTKIMYPDSGSIEMQGRVSALIELGAGFHPDMSGRENIYTNAAIFGLSKKEIDRKIDDIIAFSELEEFIDNPVRTYSSGMYMRLAFAVAINVDADILLIDEILAVGDAAFQVKCFDRLKQIKAEGTTIVIVSHSLGQIEEICERSIWIDEGVIRAEGSPSTVHGEYLDFMGVRKAEEKAKQVEEFKKLESAVLTFGSSGWSDPEGDDGNKNVWLKEKSASIDIELTKDAPASVEIYLDFRTAGRDVCIAVEGSETFTGKNLLAGEKIFSFPFKTDKLAGSKIRVNFTVSNLGGSGEIAVKGIGINYKKPKEA